MDSTKIMSWNRCYRVRTHGQSTMLPNYCTAEDAEAIAKIIEVAYQKREVLALEPEDYAAQMIDHADEIAESRMR